MSGIDVEKLTIASAAAKLKAGEITSTALTQAYLDRIDALNPMLEAVILKTADRALEDAARADKEIAAGQYKGPFHGVPYALKDIVFTKGIRSTCHSQLLIDHIPTEDAVCQQKLAAAGGVLLGKLATHEFANGGPAWDLPFPPARNPWNTECFTGGSSSGSGAGVAAALFPMAIGTDTGGSIRLPAAYCGLAGMKATYGRVSRRGVAPLGFSLDHIGPLTWTVEDCAISLNVLAGHDPLDPGSANVPVPDYTAALAKGVKGLKIGYVTTWNDGATPEMIASLNAAMDVLAKEGAEIVELQLPPISTWNAVTRAISNTEGFSVHEHDLRTRPHLYARVTRERLALGAYVTGADYVQAQRMRRQLIKMVDGLFAKVDVLATASILTPAPKLDTVETTPWRFHVPATCPFNVTGHPAMVQCTGYSTAGLPLSMQLAGPAFSEALLFQVANAYEMATPWRARRPVVTAPPARQEAAN